MNLPEIKSIITAELPRMEGWATPEKCDLLIDIVAKYHPQTIVELGVFGGKSILPMALAARFIGDCTVWGIDPWDIPSALEGEVGRENAEWWAKLDIEMIYIFFINSILKHKLTKECRWIRSKAEDAVVMFADKTVDLLHSDSNHSELVSCRQVELWAPKLSPHAIWVMDDTDWPSQKRAVQMIQDLGFNTLADKKSFIAFKR